MRNKMSQKYEGARKAKDNFTSPSDWPTDYPELRGLDGLLRCPVCFDYINIAMMIGQCSHTYCSLCIRKYLSFQNKCPSCYVPATELDLKNCRVLDDIVNNFTSLRQKLLLFIESNGQQLDTDQEKTSLSEQHGHPMKSKSICKKTVFQNKHMHDVKSCNINRSGQRVRRKLVHQLNDSDLEINGVCKNPITTDLKEKCSDDKIVIDLSLDDKEEEFIKVISSDQESQETKNKFTSSTPVATKDQQIIAGSSSQSKIISYTKLSTESNRENLDIKRHQNFSSRKDGDSCLEQELFVEDREEISVSSDRIPCPICGVNVRPQIINLHLDNCLAAKDKKISLRSATPKRKRLPKMVYNLMSDKNIRKKLKEVGLSSQGNRKMLIRRHHDFILAHNAECDCLNPRSVQEIVMELENNEKMCSSKQDDCRSNKQKLKINKNSDETCVEQAQKVYLRKHKSQFSSLIQETKTRIKEKLQEGKSEHAHTTGVKLVIPKTQGIQNFSIDGIDIQVQMFDENAECMQRNTHRKKSSRTVSLGSSLKEIFSESPFRKCEKTIVTNTVNTARDERCKDSGPINYDNVKTVGVQNIFELPNNLVSPKSDIVFALPNDIVSPRNSIWHGRKSKTNHKNLQNVISEYTEILEAGLSCDVPRLCKIEKLSSMTGSPSKHTFVDDSASEAGSEVGLIQKINSSISSFESEEAEDTVILSKYENIWPALSTRGERMRHVSEAGSSDTSDILPTAEDTQEITSTIRPTRSLLSTTSESSNSRQLRKRTREEADVEVGVPAKKRK